MYITVRVSLLKAASTPWPVRADPSENRHSEYTESQGQIKCAYAHLVKNILTVLLSEFRTLNKINLSLTFVFEVVFVSKNHVSRFRASILFDFGKPSLHFLERISSNRNEKHTIYRQQSHPAGLQPFPKSPIQLTS